MRLCIIYQKKKKQRSMHIFEKKNPKLLNYFGLDLKWALSFCLRVRLWSFNTRRNNDSSTRPSPLEYCVCVVCCFCLFTGKIYVGNISVYSSSLGHIHAYVLMPHSLNCPLGLFTYDLPTNLIKNSFNERTLEWRLLKSELYVEFGPK